MRFVGLLRGLGLEVIEQGTEPRATSAPMAEAGMRVTVSVSAGGVLFGVLGCVGRGGFGQDLLGDLLGGAAGIPGCVRVQLRAVDRDQSGAEQPSTCAHREDLAE